MINTSYDISDGRTLKEIRDFQTTHKIILPSDYVYILMNFNEFVLSNDHYGAIMSDDGEELTGIASPVFSLEDFHRTNLNWTEEMSSYYNFSTDKYFFLADLHFNGALLIGNNKGNLNQIFIDLPQENDDVIKVANHFFHFVNDIIKNYRMIIYTLQVNFSRDIMIE